MENVLYLDYNKADNIVFTSLFSFARYNTPKFSYVSRKGRGTKKPLDESESEE